VLDRPALRGGGYLREGDVLVITRHGRLVFHVLAAIDEFQRELIPRRRSIGCVVHGYHFAADTVAAQPGPDRPRGVRLVGRHG
jgi:hypothetical protein